MLRALADAVPAVLLAAMFVCFIIQVFMRYVMDDPIGWTVEVCVIAWLWILLWGQSVSAQESDEIRFDIVYGSVRPEVRRWFRVVFSIFLVGVYAWSLPALWDFVTFMKIQKTTYLNIRFNWVYSIALIFSVVSILRYAWIFWTAAQGRNTGLDIADDIGRKDFSE
tara:strand:+ start:643 stop:1140 length:498 start_codon:yes stop_codon:yes gene_type:complete